ncbi:MAG: hypothetical protein Ta2F_01150 [Termitinemataceae bacterium]|nr:MAG: hypothetical protein Ta2F_01150 [Termitinemataceae bacterium]
MNPKSPALSPSLAELLKELTKQEKGEVTEEKSPGPPHPATVFDGKKRKILAVDDVQEVLNTILAILGDTYDVRVTKTADSAISLASINDFDLFLLDYGMPDMTGAELLSIFRSMPLHKHTPAIFLTANARQEVVQKVASLGVRYYIVKPVKPDYLLARINDVFTS